MMSDPEDDNKLIAKRREKLAQLRATGDPFPNSFRRTHLAADLLAEFGALASADLAALAMTAAVAGRVMALRGPFVVVQDMTGRIQLYVNRKSLPEPQRRQVDALDVGDIVGGVGVLMKTRTDALSVRVTALHLLTKSLRPLPDKWHGLTDTEQRYRQRYVDLIMNERTREVFRVRSAVIDYLRGFLAERRFQEVETPMLQVIPGGATARPFITHHNALDMSMYLRIAPELYLKRLVVGGLERVYEINRNFRNEGLSTRHNPEFTMLEFYQAYADYRDLMALTEQMLRGLVTEVLGVSRIQSERDGVTYDFAKPFARMTVKEAIARHNPTLPAAALEDRAAAAVEARRLGIAVRDGDGLGKIQIEIFEKTVEHRLWDPVFITEYPAEVSPLARRNDADPFVTDRFELFVGGRELANGFSELNDAEDQAARFRSQVMQQHAGDDEAMHYDADYIRALEIGLPPTAGEGIGIDRLVMLLTGSPSIRDVLLFPHLRPE